MSCLTPSITFLGKALAVTTRALATPVLTITKVLNGNVAASAKVLSNSLVVAAIDTKTHLRVAASLICDVGGEKYLNVSPEEVVWLTDGEVMSYTVESNTKWRIE